MGLRSEYTGHFLIVRPIRFSSDKLNAEINLMEIENENTSETPYISIKDRWYIVRLK